MEAKFTKGQWCVDDYTNIDSTIRVMYGNIVITYFDHKTEDDLANAHLIAAAPEMYEMLEIIAKYYVDELNRPVMKSDIEKLLAKARGEQ